LLPLPAAILGPLLAGSSACLHITILRRKLDHSLCRVTGSASPMAPSGLDMFPVKRLPRAWW
jgi:hypothetical protein